MKNANIFVDVDLTLVGAGQIRVTRNLASTIIYEKVQTLISLRL